MALTETGFYRPTYDELLEAQEERAKSLFGEDIDTSSLSILGKYIRLNVADMDTLYQTLEGVYYARFPNTASGASLDRLCPFVGISRNPATYAKHKIKVTGTAGATIEGGFLVSTQSQEETFHTLQDYTIGSDGTVEVTVECEDAGVVGNVPIGDIDYIVNPSADVSEITHIGVIEYGTDIEDDYDLRERFKDSVSGSGSTTLESIKGAIMRVPNVRSVFIKENDTDSTVDGIDPHSFECFVLAPSSQDSLIAQAIFDKKPLGIKPSGDNSYTVTDAYGRQHEIKFTKTTQKNIYIKATILTNNLFPSDGVEQIKRRLVSLIEKLDNGDEVYISSLYGQIHIDGVENVSSLMLSTDGTTYTAANVICDASEVARTATNLISIEVSNS